MTTNDTGLTAEKQALIALRKMRRRLEDAERERTEPIAIIGIGCRYPGGICDPETFWQVLANRTDAVREIPASRFALDRYYNPDPHHLGTTYSRFAGLMDSVDCFDPAFFGISPREAARIDPQQRIFLETVWEALENAGIDPEKLEGSNTGVYAGSTLVEYANLRNQILSLEELDAYDLSSNAINTIAGRVSYTLGLHGPSMAIDTACSSSLVAIDRAVRSVRQGESRIAIAGGVNVLVVPEMMVAASRWGMFAPDGRCKAFDAAADGFVRAEGCGVVVLKRLSDAVADKDRILALIRGSAVNQDGASSGLTVPNGIAQEMVIRQALANAGVLPFDVGYVEAHGTGTSLGDPIEAEALGHVFSEGRSESRPLLIGSVKTNLGHTEAASGVAGLIKVVLGLMHRQVPAQLHWQAPNPHINWNEFPLKVASEEVAWEPINGRRLAGVSSFGFSGTNVHIVLEEAPVRQEAALEASERPVQLLSVTARSKAALTRLASAYLSHLKQHPDEQFRNVCHTTTIGRAHLSERLSVQTANSDEAAAALESWLAGASVATVVRGTVKPGFRPKIAFLFTGQGSQYAGMGKTLYESSAVFRDAVCRCDQALEEVLGFKASDILCASDSDRIHQTLYTQPVLFTFEHALEQLWRSWGIEPHAVLGHSLGEYVAAVSSGAMKLDDALKLVAYRAELMHSVAADGAMLAVETTEEEATATLSGHERFASLAAVNGPRQVVFSGLRATLQEIASYYDARGTRIKWLKVSQAFHSPLLDGILSEFRVRAAATVYSHTTIPLLSNVTGGVLEKLNADYWPDHMRSPVRFDSQLRKLRELGYNVLLEVGPRPALIALARLSQPGSVDECLVPSLRVGLSEWQALARAVQELDAAGVNMDWTGWDKEYARFRTVLPTYPFERERYWLSPSTRKPELNGSQIRVGKPTGSPLLGSRISSALRQKQFQNEIVPHGDTAWVRDHVVDGRIILPATAYLETMLAAGANALGEQWCELADVVFFEPLEIPEGKGRTIQVIVDPAEGDTARVMYYSCDDEHERWTLHAEGRLIRTASTVLQAGTHDAPDCTTQEDTQEFYQALQQRGVQLGPAFKLMGNLRTGLGEAYGEILVHDCVSFRIHPAALDVCFQIASISLRESIGESELLLPMSVGRLRLHASPGTMIKCHARASHVSSDGLTADITILGANNELVAELERLRFGRVRQSATIAGSLYEAVWIPRERQSRPKPLPGSWLILADSGGLGAELARRLEKIGATCKLVYEGDRYENLAAECDGIVHMWSLDQPTFATVSPENLLESQVAVYGSGLAVTHAVLGRGKAPQRGLWFVTRGANFVTAPREVSSCTAAPLWTLRRTLASEAPEVKAFAVDLDPDADCLDLLLQEMGLAEQPELSFRAGVVYVPRLTRLHSVSRSTDSQNTRVHLVPASNGSIDDMTYVHSPRQEPRPHEVEIAVRAVGLNFRDVLNALNMLPGYPRILGGECAGVVVRAGELSGFAPGDNVITFAPGVFGTYAIAAGANTVHKPANLTFVESASLPICYLTALYALHRLAHIQRGETVLIHAGAGGLGLAAIHVALAAGAIVYATAGTDEKRAYLLSLGVSKVMNSRSLEFAGDIMGVTNGRGVDIVLNSLADQFIGKSFSLVAKGGRFLEAGKRVIFTHEEAERFRPDVSYFPFDLGEDARKDSTLIPSLMKELMSGVEAGWIKPLPITTFPFSDAVQGFRFMAQSKHIGKIVILCDPLATFQINPSATYAVTGGLGALGFQSLHWLIAKGARLLLVLSRRTPDAEQASTIRRWEAAGIAVRVVQTDCADRDSLKSALAQIPREAPLRGILHCAGLLEDGILQEQSTQSFCRVAAPKVLGAWYLHELTKELDFFVMFSSASAIVGSAGQANYSAANGLLDAIASYRRSLGLTALSVNWGPWEGPGMAASAAVARHSGGLDYITPEVGFSILDQLLSSATGQAIVLPVRDWNKFPKRSGGFDSFFSLVRPHAVTHIRQPASTVTDFCQLLAAEPSANRRRFLLDHLAKHAKRILAMPESRTIDETSALHDLGLDSLMAVELRNSLNSSLNRNLPATVVLDHPTLGSLADWILLDLFGPEESQPLKAIAPPAAFAKIAAMTEDEAEAMLAQELGMKPNADSH